MTSTQNSVANYGLVSFPAFQSNSSMGTGSAIEGVYVLPKFLMADGVTPNSSGAGYGVFIDEPVGGSIFRGFSGLKSNTGTTPTTYIDVKNATTGSVQLTPQITLEGNAYINPNNFDMAWSLGGSNADAFGGSFALRINSAALGISNYNVFSCEYNGQCTFNGSLTTPPFALTAASSVSIDCSKSNQFTLTPGQAETITATNVQAGQYVNLVVLTSGTSSFTLTFSTNIKTPTSTLSTGTVSGKYFLVHYVGVTGGTLIELSRTAAI